MHSKIPPTTCLRSTSDSWAPTQTGAIASISLKTSLKLRNSSHQWWTKMRISSNSNQLHYQRNSSPTINLSTNLLPNAHKKIRSSERTINAHQFQVILKTREGLRSAIITKEVIRTNLTGGSIWPITLKTRAKSIVLRARYSLIIWTTIWKVKKLRWSRLCLKWNGRGSSLRDLISNMINIINQRDMIWNISRGRIWKLMLLWNLVINSLTTRVAVSQASTCSLKRSPTLNWTYMTLYWRKKTSCCAWRMLRTLR